MAFLFMLFWALVLIGESHLCRHIWTKLLGRGLRILATPGILVHELSHAAGCLLMGARVTDLSLYDPKGGYVSHTEPKAPVIGRPLIALAPILGCGLALYILLRAYGSGPLNRMSLPSDLELTSAGLQRFLQEMYSVVQGILIAARGANYSSIWTYVFIYLALSMGLALGPSKQDLRNAAFGVVVSAAIVYLVHLLLVYLNQGNSMNSIVLNAVWHPLSFGVGMMTVVLALSGLVWGLQRGIKSMSGRSSRGKSSKDKGGTRRDQGNS